MVAGREFRFCAPWRKQQGFAVLIALVVVSLFSLFGLYMVSNATTEVRISDNYESDIRARFAAMAGLNHARELLTGIHADDLLQGPDGAYDSGSAYMAQARTYAFRNPVPWVIARFLSVVDPASDLGIVADDGIVSTGKVGLVDGTILIPVTGLAQISPNPYALGNITASRYFVKVTDNNGEASELAKDPANNPFVDGDGVVIVRSLGISPTIGETPGLAARRNSIAVYEARIKRRHTFELDAAVVVQGSEIVPLASGMFEGDAFLIDGGPYKQGIGVIDVNLLDPYDPTLLIASQLSPSQANRVQGVGLTPSIGDLTTSLSADPDKSLLLNAGYLYDFVHDKVPRFADSVFLGAQDWTSSSAADLGFYDVSKPYNDPAQRPKVTYVDGDLAISGNLRGGGLLVVTGALSGTGTLAFDGLVLLMGGQLSGTNQRINGGVYIVRLATTAGGPVFGTPSLTISGTSSFTFDSGALRMAVRLIPVSQLGFREITPSMDPP